MAKNERMEKLPGTPPWIKKMSKRKKDIEKKAYIGEESYTGKTMGNDEHGVAKKYKEDPFRTTKTVAGVEAANHALNLATDVGAAGLAAAGGFKPLMKAVKEHGLKGLKEVGKSPAFKEDLGKMLKAQKYILPVGAGITAAYIGKALKDDLKHKKMKDMQVHDNGAEFSQWHNQNRPNEKTAGVHDKELSLFVRTILADKRPDSKYNPSELKEGIKIEHEHTKSSFIAKKIAKDHLDEIPDYYTRLKKLEEAAKKQMGKKD
jgi:hypothetical protein